MRYDHEGIPLSCDPNNNYLFYSYGPYKKCMYGKDVLEYQFEYALDFWKTYEQEKKLLYLDFITNHEESQEKVKHLDEPLVQFLQLIEKKGWLEDTAILFYSDHGFHYPPPPAYEYYTFTFTERALPALFINLPRKVSDKYRVMIKENQQKFVSPFTIYSSFLTIAEGAGSSHFKSSLLADLPAISCDDIRTFRQGCFCNYE